MGPQRALKHCLSFVELSALIAPEHTCASQVSEAAYHSPEPLNHSHVGNPRYQVYTLNKGTDVLFHFQIDLECQKNTDWFKIDLVEDVETFPVEMLTRQICISALIGGRELSPLWR